MFEVAVVIVMSVSKATHFSAPRDQTIMVHMITTTVLGQLNQFFHQSDLQKSQKAFHQSMPVLLCVPARQYGFLLFVQIFGHGKLSVLSVLVVLVILPFNLRQRWVLESLCFLAQIAREKKP